MPKKIAKSSGRTLDIREVNQSGQSEDFSVRQIQDDSGRGFSAQRVQDQMVRQPHHDNDEDEIESVSIPVEPSEKVRVKFEKLVQLIATHNFQEVLKKNPAEEVILSTNLLADLANAHEEPTGERKIPVILFIGILIGVGLTYILFKL